MCPKEPTLSWQGGTIVGSVFRHGLCHTWGFPGGSDGKESACNAGDPGLDPWSGRSLREGNRYPLPPIFLPVEFHGQRNLAGYSPWGCKESDTT